MGWNCTLVLVRGASLADLAAIGWTPTAATLAWDEVSSMGYDATAAWERDGDLVVASGGLDLIGEVERLGTLGETYAGLMKSVTDSYLWETAGPVGRRRWHWSSYEVILDLGTPHPAEAGIERLDADSLFGLLAAVGLTYDERLEEASFTQLDTGGRGGAPTERPPRRKRFGIF
jgi:hypothetical protein